MNPRLKLRKNQENGELMIETRDRESRKRWTHGCNFGEIKKTVNSWLKLRRKNKTTVNSWLKLRRKNKKTANSWLKQRENEENGELMVETTERNQGNGWISVRAEIKSSFSKANMFSYPRCSDYEYFTSLCVFEETFFDVLKSKLNNCSASFVYCQHCSTPLFSLGQTQFVICICLAFLRTPRSSIDTESDEGIMIMYRRHP